MKIDIWVVVAFDTWEWDLNVESYHQFSFIIK